MAPLKPTGFWSYASSDDAASEGRLSQLRRLLANQLQGHVGRGEVHIFQDVAAIPPGTEWERQIDQALQQSSFFIPIITPGFLQSEWCTKEVVRFRAIMEWSGRSDLIVPIHYLDVDGFDTVRRGECFDPAVLTYLRSLQWVNFRPLRLRDPMKEDVQRALDEVATGILNALYRKSPSPRVPPDPAKRLQTVDTMPPALGLDEPAEEPTVVTPPPSAPTAPPSWQRDVWRWGVGTGALALCVWGYLELRDPATPPPAGREEVAASMPANVAPARQPPQRTQQLTAARGQPEAAPSVTSAPSSPVEQARREAPVMPPPAPSPVPTPPPSTAPSPLELGQVEAQSLPCSMVNIANGQNGIRVSGLAMASPEIDQFLAGWHNAGHVAGDITRLDRFACAPIEMVKAFVQRTKKSTPPTFAIQLDKRSIASGARLGINVTTTLPALYVDLYQGDGSVRHLSRPVVGAPRKSRAEWIAMPPAGQRLIVAIGAAAPLDLGARPETEPASGYLAALRSRLQGAGEPPVADLAMVTVDAAEPTAKLPPPQLKRLQSDRCENITARAQLGETLSDAELAALRTECRS
jgi:hypothetical protein